MNLKNKKKIFYYYDQSNKDAGEITEYIKNNCNSAIIKKMKSLEKK